MHSQVSMYIALSTTVVSPPKCGVPGKLLESCTTSMALQQPCFNCDQMHTVTGKVPFTVQLSTHFSPLHWRDRWCHASVPWSWVHARASLYPCHGLDAPLYLCHGGPFDLHLSLPESLWYVLHCRLCFWQHGYPVETLTIKNSNRWQWEIGDVTMS